MGNSAETIDSCSIAPHSCIDIDNCVEPPIRSVVSAMLRPDTFYWGNSTHPELDKNPTTVNDSNDPSDVKKLSVLVKLMQKTLSSIALKTTISHTIQAV